MSNQSSLSRRDFLRNSGRLAGLLSLASSPLFGLALTPSQALPTLQESYQSRSDIRSLPFDSHQFQWRYRRAIDQESTLL